ncbi:TIGR03067 domain-containing protein [Gemmata sp.]|uniref:TIGR03067 domain-containing protein n=1 Tax=Gemmata sp. TaxID=1914242 RepID=UPI003F70937D
MRKLIAAAAFLALAAPVLRADERADAAKKLDGKYEVVSVLVNGKPDDKKKDEAKGVEIKDGTLSIKGEKRTESVKFALDPSKKPAHIDLSVGPDEKVLGLYEAKETDKGLELVITFSKGLTKDRPKDFKGEGEDMMVLTLLRKK